MTRKTHCSRSACRQTQKTPEQRLTDKIMEEGRTPTAASAPALALTHASLTADEWQTWSKDMEARLATIQQHPEQHLGFIEEALAQGSKEVQRVLAERAAQVKANTTPCTCAHCQTELTHQKPLARSADSRFGSLRVWRLYGWCPVCEVWQFPADLVLGLAKNAPASPYLQEISALLASKMPPAQAILVAERFGVKLACSTLHREAHRQGIKAETARTASLSQLDTWEGIQQLTQANADPSAQPFTLVIEIDAWNIRERDDWGQTQTLRAQGQALSRWHWVYVGTVFRLDHRGQTAGDRPIISQRGYASTRLGIGALMRQLHRQALDCGLGQAQEVLVLGDGAVWIWNAFADRFPKARQRLDLYHADQYLWSVAHELYGQGTVEAQQWVAPLLKQIRQDQTPKVIHTLSELQAHLEPALQQKLQTQIDYLENNKNRMQYRAILQARKACAKGNATPAQRLKANEPLGSGAIESTCRQYQCRFKRTGQFWTMAGDEALMCLETYWRNGRWHELYPHAQRTAPKPRLIHH